MSTRHHRPSAETAALIQAQRRQLFRAAAVVAVVRYASVSTTEGLSDETVADALDVAYALIDGAASALEIVGTSREG